MCTKFQVDWTSASSKTTLIKNFNLKWDRRTDGRPNAWMHRPENIMPINGAKQNIVERKNSGLAKMKVR